MTVCENIDPSELSRFSHMADFWWDAKGPLGALHEINPVRLSYVADRMPLKDAAILDVGCGGGLFSEALASKGARVTGIDFSEAGLSAARYHMAASGFDIDYRKATAEALAQEAPERFDGVVCMELIEHVPDPASVIRACAHLTKPGGHVFFATVNRTWLARLLVIWASENVLHIVGKGTHRYEKLVKPEELNKWGIKAGLVRVHLTGLRYLPFINYVRLCNSTAMNYMMHFRRSV
ncbi:bifunctional 2-polyprenyl-6-hydroxyphenol methylase/3-demethylubiquinol 3-O-methyltransferase UbiG [Desulfosarcina sp. OttesenSCG-928-A07]|nr:bifunctional 2-polyprenyl-6-hydroxyphenol methylase/3-demethylubiquinol 3-O-methyltransferase UbiG [Desulfosarcina sp. OttesenSCG-928-G17]MDL2328265.1 bifunctional 2-polyprenyl-6-hydroxyphenol methylase/3-demethylubiquinol 3-O-methyltransferase UbiG [Desulfosarcina sp. OttesenSCG-928-A07]